MAATGSMVSGRTITLVARKDRSSLVITIGIIVLACLASLACGSHSRGPKTVALFPKCSLVAIEFTISPEYTNGEVFIGLTARTPLRYCELRANGTVTLAKDGRELKVNNNPATVLVKGIVRNASKDIVGAAWWYNWCSANVKPTVMLKIGGRLIDKPLPLKPQCTNKKTASKLITIK